MSSEGHERPHRKCSGLGFWKTTRIMARRHGGSAAAPRLGAKKRALEIALKPSESAGCRSRFKRLHTRRDQLVLRGITPAEIVMADVANCINVQISQNNPGGITPWSAAAPDDGPGVQLVFVNLVLPHDLQRPNWDWTTIIGNLTIQIVAIGDVLAFQWTVGYGGSQVQDVNGGVINWWLVLKSGQQTWPPGNPTALKGAFPRQCGRNGSGNVLLKMQTNVLQPPPDPWDFFKNCSEATLNIRWPTVIGRC
jgi:hypothetical protein